MALINQPIANLFNGVSQQPAPLRQSSQGEASENLYPTIALGLNKRPPTRHVAKLTASPSTDAFVAILNRDPTERYVLVLRNGAIEVYDATTGAQKSVTLPAGNSYLVCGSPVDDFTAVAVADHTFIVNKRIKAQAGPAFAASNPNVGYVSFSYSGAGVSRTMTVTVNGVSASYTGSDNSISAAISAIHTGLSLALGAGWSVSLLDSNIIKILRTGSSDTSWPLEVTDNYGNSTMRAIKGAVQLFSDLPHRVDDGYICHITSSPDKEGSGYYVRYDSAIKSYVECPKPGVLTTIERNSMPHRLVRNSDGTFTFEPFDWEPRKVGDLESNPWPSFIGRQIADIFLYRNRLGTLADENVILSKPGDFYNFFATTAAAVTAADPIDLNAAQSKVSILRHAIPFNKSLILFSDQTQLQLHASDALTAETVKADTVTEFVASAGCKPVGAGSQLFFAFDKGESTGVREYYVSQDTMANDAADVTAHVPSYIPSGVFKMSVSTSEDLLLLLTKEERNAIYAYKYYWGAEEKIQSAWQRFSFASDDCVMGVEFIGSQALIVTARADGLYLEEMDFQAGVMDPGLSFSALIDRKVSLQGTYTAGDNTTRWTLPWSVPSGAVVEAVLGSAFGTSAGRVIQLYGAGTSVSAQGNLSAGQCFIGLRYSGRYRFSEQFRRDENKQVIASAEIKIRRMLVSYADSGYFRVEVTPLGRQKNTYVFTGPQLGAAGALLGSTGLASGTFRFPVMSSSRGVTIELVNDSPLPSAFQSAEWEGEVVIRAQR